MRQQNSKQGPLNFCYTNNSNQSSLTYKNPTSKKHQELYYGTKFDRRNGDKVTRYINREQGGKKRE